MHLNRFCAVLLAVTLLPTVGWAEQDTPQHPAAEEDIPPAYSPMPNESSEVEESHPSLEGNEPERPFDPNSVEEQVGRDAVLGGDYVLGPLNMLPLGTMMAPTVGALFGAWAAEQRQSSQQGSVVRGLVAGYASSFIKNAAPILAYSLWLVPMLVMTGTLSFVSPHLSVILGTALGLGLVAPYAAIGAMLVGLGLYELALWPWMFVGAGGVLLGLALAQRASILVADKIWDGMGRGAKPPWKALEPSLRARIAGSRPLNRFAAASLMVAAMGGAYLRYAPLSLIPVVGPVMVALMSSDDVAQRGSQAQMVAGLPQGPDLRVLINRLMVFRAVVGTLASVGGMSAGYAAVAGMGLGFVAVGAGLFVVQPSSLLVSAAVAMASILPVYLVIIPMLGAATVLLGIGLADMVMPWVVAGYSLYNTPHETQQVRAPLVNPPSFDPGAEVVAR